jgi:hypothetical protein
LSLIIKTQIEVYVQWCNFIKHKVSMQLLDSQQKRHMGLSTVHGKNYSS